jgi:hypothetical protein
MTLDGRTVFECFIVTPNLWHKCMKFCKSWKHCDELAGPTNIRDIIFINGFVNIINKPTHFDNRTGNYSLLDPILITDSISIIDSDTLHIDREVSDHDGTYVTIGCGFSNNTNYKRKISKTITYSYLSSQSGIKPNFVVISYNYLPCWNAYTSYFQKYWPLHEYHMHQLLNWPSLFQIFICFIRR